ncbi:predicted protein [Streptomyces viridosporus ATCC 14672]|uniref:Predicted protein n=1 Tax=Streptomyces viridosporus (strain ATCC 14672 / DSM 40746 / JCM 4963 / KCTC 9882 / NRRL B-12104 / FH 1290) TaxID=566461 RepID=D5ZSN1_STRV1|nr:predicted protein [Streptomyces viridosporus ATCC 14672]
MEAPPEHERFKVLTPREHEALLLISEGLPNAEIAHRTGHQPRDHEDLRLPHSHHTGSPRPRPGGGPGLSSGVGRGTATEPDGPVMPCGAASRQQRRPAHSSSDTPHGGHSALGIGTGSPERATCFVLPGVTHATGGLLLTRIVNTAAGQGRPAQ